VPVLGIDTNDLSMFPFHGLQVSTEHYLSNAVLRLARVLIITILPRPVLINNHDGDCRPNPKRQKQGLRCRAYIRGTGILTCFPFLYKLKL
jgi:hypothetical protein